MNSKVKFLVGLIMAVAVALAPEAAFATNTIPLKPDGSHAAPMTVFGDTVNGVSIGKTTAPTGALDVVGDINATGTISGTIDTTKIPSNAIDTAKLAAGAVTAAKIAPAAVDTSKLGLGAVTTNQLGNAAVDTTKIAAGSIDTSKLLKNGSGGGALCELPSTPGTFGHCTNASAATCTCQ